MRSSRGKRKLVSTLAKRRNAVDCPHMKILLVEDNEKLARSTAEGLMDAGFVVSVAGDGLAAEKKLLRDAGEYDIVLLDRMLPGKDGLSIAKAWRQAGITVPILMLTALDTTADTVEGLYAGADDYLAKPFAFQELVARIHTLLRRPRASLSPALEIAGIRLDPRAQSVEKDGEKVALTLKEFMLLEYLMRNAGSVVTRDTLYGHVWDFADASFSNTVDVHIKNLRRKLHDEGTIIQTIRGTGYKI